jgi:hypothetical protein
MDNDGKSPSAKSAKKREKIMESTREARTEAKDAWVQEIMAEIAEERELCKDDLCPFCEAGGIRSPAASGAPWVCVDVGNTKLLYGWLCRSCMDAGIDLG